MGRRLDIAKARASVPVEASCFCCRNAGAASCATEARFWALPLRSGGQLRKRASQSVLTSKSSQPPGALPMNILIVFDHPRCDSSFCGASARPSAGGGSPQRATALEVADLRAEGFDPRLPVADEPDWDNPDKVYSAEVLREQERISRNDALAFVFPVWWWSFPAATKGWIDRVWNNGWAYGARTLPHQKALLIGAASNDAAVMPSATTTA